MNCLAWALGIAGLWGIAAVLILRGFNHTDQDENDEDDWHY